LRAEILFWHSLLGTQVRLGKFFFFKQNTECFKNSIIIVTLYMWKRTGCFSFFFSFVPYNCSFDKWLHQEQEVKFSKSLHEEKSVRIWFYVYLSASIMNFLLTNWLAIGPLWAVIYSTIQIDKEIDIDTFILHPCLSNQSIMSRKFYSAIHKYEDRFEVFDNRLWISLNVGRCFRLKFQQLFIISNLYQMSDINYIISMLPANGLGLKLFESAFNNLVIPGCISEFRLTVYHSTFNKL